MGSAGDDKIGAGLRQSQGYAATNAATTAGHNGGLSLEGEHGDDSGAHWLNLKPSINVHFRPLSRTQPLEAQVPPSIGRTMPVT